MSNERFDIIEWIVYFIIGTLAYCVFAGCSSPEGTFQCGRAADAARDVHYVATCWPWILWKEIEDGRTTRNEDSQEPCHE